MTSTKPSLRSGRSPNCGCGPTGGGRCRDQAASPAWPSRACGVGGAGSSPRGARVASAAIGQHETARGGEDGAQHAGELGA